MVHRSASTSSSCPSDKTAKVDEDFYKFKCLSLNEIGNNNPTSVNVLYECLNFDFQDTVKLNRLSPKLSLTMSKSRRKLAPSSTMCNPSELTSTHSVVILGELSVGKSALCRNFFRTGLERSDNGNHFDASDHVEETGDDVFDDVTDESAKNHHIYERPVVVNDISCRIRILDVNTEKQFMENSQADGFGNLAPYVDIGDGFIVTYAVTDVGTFRTARDILSRICESLSNRALSSPAILVGNKCDLVRKRQVSTNDGIKLAEKYKVKFVETSASLNQNVDQLFHGVINQIRLRGVLGRPRSAEENTKYSKNRFSKPSLFSRQELTKGNQSPVARIEEQQSYGSSTSSMDSIKMPKDNSDFIRKALPVKLLRKIRRRKTSDALRDCQDFSVL